MTDPQTLSFYDREAAVYADYTVRDADLAQLDRFLALLEPGDRVLDFGCGAGWAGGIMLERGFVAEGYDGSAGLAAEARARYGMKVDVGPFDRFAAPPSGYHGIWASFCLLHDLREAMPGHLARLAATLKPRGPLYLGLKEGSGMVRDHLGRRYTYFERDEIAGYLKDNGFGSIDVETDSGLDYAGVPCSYLHIIARKGQTHLPQT